MTLGIWGLPLLFVTVVASYAAGAQLALQLIEASGLQGVLFIPAGITVAFLLRLPGRVWWIVLTAAGLAEFSMDVLAGLGITQSLGFALANVVEPLAGAAIVGLMCAMVDLARRRDLMAYAIGAVVAGPAIGAAFGALADRLFGGDDFVATFSQWWLGDALGVILVGSAILAWGSGPDRRPLRSVWGAALLIGSVLLTTLVVTITDLPLVFTALIGVIVAGALFGTRASAMTSLTVAMTLAVLLVADSSDLIVGLSQAEALVLIKLQVGTFAMAGLLIAAESNERELAINIATRATLEAEMFERESRRERNLAVSIQRSLLPDRVLEHDKAEFAARYEAAGEQFEVGGDWYDTIDLGDGRIGLVVGDIVGHGFDAMTSMGRLRTALAALAMHNDSPSRLLTELDAFVGGPDGVDYATVFYAVVDLDAETIVYASAGHPPALLTSPLDPAVWLDGGQSGPLYGDRSVVRKEAVARLVEGSTLVLYTDGLIERRGESLNEGMNRLRQAAGEIHTAPARAICDELFTRLVHQSDRSDDVVVLVMKAETRPPHVYHGIFRAEPDELRNIRAAVRTWANDNAIAQQTVDDLILALGEATSNAVRHAYKDTVPGQVEIRINLDPHAVHVTVADRGRWQHRDPNGVGGMGIGLIEAVTADLTTESDDLGTRLSFSLPIK